MKRQKNTLTAALAAAFPHTIPILTGFLFLGATCGIYMRACGLAAWYPMVMSLVIFAGSMEFVTCDMLLGAFHPLQAFLMTLMINARHLFYGISMLDKYKGTGLKKFYLIFGMCDESFSVNCTADIPDGVDKGWFMFFVNLLNQLYWFAGVTLGALTGSLLKLNTEGLDFVMTAMFVVIFLDQWDKDKNHLPALLGIGLSFLCRLLFSADGFMIPSMLTIVLCLTVLRKKPAKGDLLK